MRYQCGAPPTLPLAQVASSAQQEGLEFDWRTELQQTSVVMLLLSESIKLMRIRYLYLTC